ncbi:hybrid sensor histidine kinase/response regulator [Rubrimonas cliftonensis]|uniref:histidine kinase n=1 Tax=Rubrimonas cliftonensis TaxID=89524 RepID=A0A1H3VJJ5_9RHOB|nr:NahK/ErcS family hybrid sensor histidine kinase/response regulator [Rubrimonas cliftonensis]SDZ74851.1 Signal transduction histidine kinase [Rubrimonas cliftonensis]
MPEKLKVSFFGPGEGGGASPEIGLDAALSDNERLRRANDALRERMERQAAHGLDGAQRATDAGEAQLLARRQAQAALDVCADGLALFSEDGRLTLYNTRLQAMLPDAGARITAGQRLDDAARALCGSSALALEPDSRSALAAALSGSEQSARTAPLTDGRWVEFTLRRAAGGPFALVVSDVTALVARGAAALQDGEGGVGGWPDRALDRLRIGLAAFDEDGALARCNGPFRALLGLGLAAAQPGAPMVALIADATGVGPAAGGAAGPAGPATGRVAGALAEWLRGPRPRPPLSTDLRARDGRVLRVNCHDGEGDGVSMTLADITEDRESAEELERARRTLESRVVERTAALTDLNDRLVQEVAERRAIESEMRRARDAAEAANLSKTRFLAAASHDLLQPLNAAKLFLSALAASRLSPEASETVARVESAFGSVEALLNALLDISKLDAGGGEAHIADFPVARVLKPVAEEFGPVAAARGLKLSVAPCSAIVRSDPHYLRRIVQNLVSNALKYTIRGGVVLGCRRRGETLRIEVWDSGVGVPPSERRRVFEEFHRIDAANPRGERGMGLGLAIVDRASRLLGHRVDVRSQPGVGSVFSVTAPLGCAGAARAAREAGETDAPHFGDARGMIALVLDDDDAVRGATSALLARWGVDAMEAATAGQAVSAVRQLGMSPDVMLLDYHLGDGLTGLQALRRLREETGVEAPAVIITADRSRALEAAAAEAGAEVLTKPVAPAKLRALLQWSRAAADGALGA